MKQSAPRGRTASEIAQSLEAAIHAGEYRSGALLPTVRDLASSLKVSPATAGAAYRLLQSRGLLSGDRRRGTRVTAVRELHGSPARSRGSVADGIVDVASGNPDPRLLPPLSPAFRALSDLPALYGDEPDLRPFVAFAKSELVADGIPISDLLVTSGALDAIDRILRERLRPGDRVVVEDPCFPALLDLLTASGFVVESMDLDAEGPLPDAMDAALKRRPGAVIVTPRAHNPTGAAITAARATDLRAVLERYEAPLLVENDPFGPVAGAPAVTLTQGRPQWAIVRSTSKFLGPDLRVAVLAGDAMTLARVRGRQAVGARWVSHVLQELALTLWSDPASGRHLARAGDVYTRRREAFLEALARHGVAVRAASGFNVWIPVRHEAAVVQHLADSGWAVAAGERFRLRSGPGIRITTSALESPDAQRLASALAEALQGSSLVMA